jgi:hypothetical protein
MIAFLTASSFKVQVAWFVNHIARDNAVQNWIRDRIWYFG